MKRSELRATLRRLQQDDVGDPAGVSGLPDLPLRFPLRLSRVDRELFSQYMDLQELPDLELTGGYELLWPGHGNLGTFATRELAILRRLGDWSALYTPRVLEISPTGWVAIELVRPVLSVCHNCQRVYPEGFKRCERCRAALHDERGAGPFIDFAAILEELRAGENKGPGAS